MTALGSNSKDLNKENKTTDINRRIRLAWERSQKYCKRKKMYTVFKDESL